MSDMSGLKLKEPDQVDWDKMAQGSKYTPPPPTITGTGDSIIYNAQLPTDLGDPKRFELNQNGFRRFQVGPLILQKNGGTVDGYQVRFYSVDTEMYTGKDGKPTGRNSAASLIRAAGVAAKPQKTIEYESAIKMASGRVIPIVLKWVAQHKDTGFEVIGEENFPLDEAGRRRAILKAGDVLPDGRTVPSTVEVMFANARVRYVKDSRK